MRPCELYAGMFFERYNPGDGNRLCMILERPTFSGWRQRRFKYLVIDDMGLPHVAEYCTHKDTDLLYTELK